MSSKPVMKTAIQVCKDGDGVIDQLMNTLSYVLQETSQVCLLQACFLCTFEKTQGQINSMFWPLAKNSRIFSQKTQSYEAQSKGQL